VGASRFRKVTLSFALAGAGAVSEAVQAAFPVAASVPSLLQTDQPSQNHQKRSGGKDNRAI